MASSSYHGALTVASSSYHGALTVASSSYHKWQARLTINGKTKGDHCFMLSIMRFLTHGNFVRLADISWAACLEALISS